jgi:apolipoprotein N-acyltransferase
MLLAFVLLYSLIPLIAQQSRLQQAGHGFFWGCLVFSFHFHWLLLALKQHGGCSMFLVTALLLPLIGYFSLLIAGWFCLMAFGGRWLVAPLTALFWFLLDAYGLVPFGMGMGYPFINPCIPLANYRWFVALISFFIPPHMPAPTDQLRQRLCYVPPVVNRVVAHDQPWTRSPHAVVHRLAKQISFAHEEQSILVSPESAVLFSLQDHQELVAVLAPKSNAQTAFILGALRNNTNVIEQVACELQAGLIIKTYVKKILVPFAEQTPPAWQWLQGLRQRLAPGYVEGGVVDVVGDNDDHMVVAGVSVRPALCLEFFQLPARAFACQQTDAVLALINDSWYCPLFRRWLFLLGVLKSHTMGRLVVYIGHFGCYTIDPKKHTITSVRSCYASLHA